MARTPLALRFRSLFRDLSLSRRTGVPVDELRDQRAERKAQHGGPSRRHVLLGGAAGAAALALPRPVRAAPSGGGSIAIIGGGIAGLTCALGLLDRGLESTVYEASDRLGGRMFSNRSGYWANGQVSEWGGELIDSGHLTMLGLADRFGLPVDDLLAAQPAGARDIMRVHGGYYSAHDADRDFAAIWETIKDDLHAAPYAQTYDSNIPSGAALSAMSVYDWIESRVPGGHDSPLGEVLDLAYAIEFGADTVDQSALNLLYLIAYQPTPFKGELAMFGVSDEQYHIRGGNQRLPEAIGAHLGSRVVTGHKLVRIKQTAGGRYQLTFERGSQTVETTYDHVVLALPFAAYTFDYSQAGFDALKHRAINELGRGHNGKLQLQFNTRGWNGTGPWPGVSGGSTYSDTGYQASWDVSRAQAGAAGILCLYSGGSVTDAMRTTTAFGTHTDARVRGDAADGLAELAPVYPGLSWNGKVTQSIWHKAPLFNASYSFYRTGQYTQFAGYEKVQQGNVHFCGEHTNMDYQGFMEGGAFSGELVAKALRQIVRNQ